MSTGSTSSLRRIAQTASKTTSPTDHSSRADHGLQTDHGSRADHSSRADHGNDDRDARTCDLLRRAATARGASRRELHEQAIWLNLPLADALARHYHDRGEDHDDLVQVARLGLVKAVERFDPQRGDFSVYAVPTIAGELKRHFRDHGWSVRPPRRIQELQSDLSAAWSECAQQLGHTPHDADLADYLGRDLAEVRDAMAAQGCFRTDSLDAPAGGGLRLCDQIGCADSDFAHAELIAVLAPACRRLSRDDRRLLYLRFVEQLAQAEIARRLGTNQMAISRRLRRLLDHLGEELAGAVEVREEVADSLAA